MKRNNNQIGSSLTLDLFCALQRKVKGYTTISAYIRGLVEKALSDSEESAELKVLKREYEQLEKAHKALRYTRRRKKLQKEVLTKQEDPLAFFDALKKS
jgi:hypothetical protein